MPLSHPFFNNLWSGGRFTPYYPLWSRNSSWNAHSQKQSKTLYLTNTQNPKLHHYLGVPMLKREKRTARKPKKQGGCHGSSPSSQLWKCSIFITTMSLDWLRCREKWLQQAKLTTGWNINRDPVCSCSVRKSTQMFIWNVLVSIAKHLFCIHKQIYLETKLIVPRLLDEHEIRVKRAVGGANVYGWS